GPQGPLGNTGPQGPFGDTGPQGPLGDTGQVGNTGPQGIQGESGFSSNIDSKLDISDFVVSSNIINSSNVRYDDEILQINSNIKKNQI
ncbi:hypothetical protein T492DRAFT_606971, partial [Pavlovales sp. CCMP2436]